MSQPTDKKLYEKVKTEIYKKYPQHSAYRSGLLVKEYKSRGGKYSGKENQSTGLNRWFREGWKNQRNESGYKYKSDVYRPTKRITKDTPATFSELSKKRLIEPDVKKHLKVELRNSNKLSEPIND